MLTFTLLHILPNKTLCRIAAPWCYFLFVYVFYFFALSCSSVLPQWPSFPTGIRVWSSNAIPASVNSLIQPLTASFYTSRGRPKLINYVKQSSVETGSIQAKIVSKGLRCELTIWVNQYHIYIHWAMWKYELLNCLKGCRSEHKSISVNRSTAVVLGGQRPTQVLSHAAKTAFN